jgi:hypothetical protein
MNITKTLLLSFAILAGLFLIDFLFLGVIQEISKNKTEVAEVVDLVQAAIEPIQTTDESIQAAQERQIEIIFGMALNQQIQSLHVFVKSFRKYAPKTARIIFFNEAGLSDETKELFEEFSVESHELYDVGVPVGYGVETARYYLVRDLIMKSQFPNNSRLIFTDVKDVVFQSNPFALFGNETSIFLPTLEGDALIGPCPFNGDVVKQCFGEEVYNRLADKVITCSGVTLATLDEAMIYLDWMTSQMTNRPCIRKGVDQGFHAVYVYDEPQRNSKPIGLHESAVATLNYIPITMATLENGIFVRLSDLTRKPITIVHQYNRRAGLAEYFEALYYGHI